MGDWTFFSSEALGCWDRRLPVSFSVNGEIDGLWFFISNSREWNFTLDAANFILDDARFYSGCPGYRGFDINPLNSKYSARTLSKFDVALVCLLGTLTAYCTEDRDRIFLPAMFHMQVLPSSVSHIARCRRKIC